MFNIISETTTNFIPVIMLDKKRSEGSSQQPLIESSGITHSLIPSAPAQMTPYLSLSKRDIETLESAIGENFAEFATFKKWALSEIALENIKPSELYRYFVYLLGHQKNHPSLLAIAKKLKDMSLDGELDPKKVSALVNTVFAQRTPIMPRGTTLTKPTSASHINGLDHSQIGHIFSFMLENSLPCLNKHMRALSFHPNIAKIVNRNVLVRKNPALVRWIESLRLPTTNWSEIHSLLRQPNFLSPTVRYDNYSGFFTLSNGRLAFRAKGSADKLSVLNLDTSAIESSFQADKMDGQQGEFSLIDVALLPNRRLAIAFRRDRGLINNLRHSVLINSPCHNGLINNLMIYDTQEDKVISISDVSEAIRSLATVGDGLLAVVMKSGIQIRDSQTGLLKRTLSQLEAQDVDRLFDLPNGLFATSYSFYSPIRRFFACIWDLEGTLKHTLPCEWHEACDIVVTFEGKLLLRSPSGMTSEWNFTAGDRSMMDLKGPHHDFNPLPHDLILLNKKDIVRATTGEHIMSLDLPLDILDKNPIWPETFRNGRILVPYHNCDPKIDRYIYQYDQIPRLIAAATTAIPSLPPTPQPVIAPPAFIRRVAVNPERRRCSEPLQGNVRLWIALAVLVSAIALYWITHRMQTGSQNA